MKQRVFIIICSALLCLHGCGGGQEALNRKLKSTITRYMESSIEGFRVDSIRILGIDSLTDLQYAYLNKVVYQNYEEQLEQHYLLYVTPDTEEEWDEQERVQLQLQKIKDQLLRCDSILLSPGTDTVKLQYFFVATHVFGKNKHAEAEVHEVGFPISKQFKVMELNVE